MRKVGSQVELYPNDDDTPERSAFAAVPLWLLNSDVSDRAVRLYAVLQTYLRGTEGVAFPKRQTLADRMGKSPDTVDRAVRELVAVEAIAVERRWTEQGDPTSNAYVVFFDSPELAHRRGDPAAKTRTGGRENAGSGSRENAARSNTQVDPDPPIHTRMADLAASLDVATATAREMAEQRFDDHFWPAYPARNGKKLDKGKALTQWLKLSIDDQRAAVKGARYYAASGQIPKDAHRWLRDRCWEDWQTPAASAAVRGGGTSGEYVAAAMEAMRDGR